MMCTEERDIYKPYIELANYAVDEVSKNIGKPILLDAGCGHSNALKDVYEKCHTTIGVDIDKEGLKLNSLLDKKIHANLIDIPIPDNSVNIITSAWVFEHIKEPEKFLREMDRILSSGGYLVFIAPNRKSWFSFIASIIPQRIHGFINKLIYKRAEEDTFPKYYRLNTEKDIDKILLSKLKYKKVKFKYNDSPKYIGFCSLTKPISKLWHRIVMKEKNKKLRVHILGLYSKP